MRRGGVLARLRPPVFFALGSAWVTKQVGYSSHWIAMLTIGLASATAVGGAERAVVAISKDSAWHGDCSSRRPMNNTFDDITLDLDRVHGGFDAGKCFDDVAPWAAGGALAGAPTGPGTAALGALAGGGAAAATSVNCGDGTRSPMTMAREGLSSAMKNLPSGYTPTGGVTP